MTLPAPAASPADSRQRDLAQPNCGHSDQLAAPRQVLHVINGEHYAGTERAQDLLATRLVDFGYQVSFVCLKNGRYVQSRKATTTPLETVAMRSRFDLRPARRVAQMIRRQRFCLVHSHTPRSALIGGLAARWAGVPLVHHVHSPTNRDSTHALRNRVNAWIERWSLSGAGGVIPVSHSMGRYARGQNFAPRHFSVVPNGVPPRLPLAERATPRGSWTIGTIALFRPRKGLDVLLTALAQLRAAGHDVRLRAVGGFETPDYERQIMAQVSQLGIAAAIDWRGFCHDVFAELAEMDLFALPSLFGEGLPFVILEAMAAGVPIVASDVEGIPEVVRDGQEGLIVAPADPAALAAGVVRVISGQCEWQALRRSAFERQTSQYTDRTMAAGVAAVYDALLSANPRVKTSA